MDQIDCRVLSCIQSGFPLVRRPYATIGKTCSISESDALAHVGRMRATGDIRRIGAVFDSAHLGYASTLCAIAVEREEALEGVAQQVSAYREVTHNYERGDRYNLWFTLIARDRRRIDEILGEIRGKTGCSDILDLPATQLFKIRVDFDLTDKRETVQEPTENSDAGVTAPRGAVTIAAGREARTFSALERALVRLVQGDLGDIATPFDEIARIMQDQGYPMDVDEVLERVSSWTQEGVIRRFGAVLRHRRLGFSHNAMGVWNIPDAHVDEAGAIMARARAVSHCYRRPRAQTWPHNMYTMIHGRQQEECESCASTILEALHRHGIEAPMPRLLYSTREFKKQSMRYFIEEEHV